MTEVAEVVTRMANLSRMAQVVRGEGVVNPFMRQKSPPLTPLDATAEP